MNSAQALSHGPLLQWRLTQRLYVSSFRPFFSRGVLRPNSSPAFSRSFCDHKEPVPPESSEAASADGKSAEKRVAAEKAKRYAAERTEYEAKLKRLRKLFAEEHARRVAEGGAKPKTFKKNAWAKPYPKEMLPRINLPRELTPEYLEDMAQRRKEAKAERRLREERRREQAKGAEEERRGKVVRELEGEVEMWLSQRDLESPALFEAKVALQLEKLVPFQEAFYEELPSQPYRFFRMYHRDEVVRESLTVDRHLPTAEPDDLEKLLQRESQELAEMGRDASGEGSREKEAAEGRSSDMNGRDGVASNAQADQGASNEGDISKESVESSEILQILQEMESKPKDKTD